MPIELRFAWQRRPEAPAPSHQRLRPEQPLRDRDHDLAQQPRMAHHLIARIFAYVRKSRRGISIYTLWSLYIHAYDDDDGVRSGAQDTFGRRRALS